MRALLFSIAMALGFLLGSVIEVHAQIVCTAGQSPVWTANGWTCATPAAQPLPAGAAVNMTIANEGATGTTINRLAKLTGAPSTAIITTAGDTEGAIGVVTAGAGITGNATIAIIGQVTCDFDGATTAGDYVVISATTAGMCHDEGAAFPNGKATYGRVLSTNVGAGAYVMELMTPDISFQNAGNGKSRPGGSSLDYQYNNAGTFGGAGLKQETADTVAQRRGTNAQDFAVYRTFTDASNYTRLRLRSDSSFAYISSEAAGTGTKQPLVVQAQNTVQLQSFLGSSGGTQSTVTLASEEFKPSSTGTYELGNSGLRWEYTWTNGLATQETAPAQITANQNNYAPGTANYLQEWSTDASRNITGVNVGTTVAGRMLRIINVGAFDIVLVNESASSSANNRFHNTTGADITLVAGQWAECVYLTAGGNNRWWCKP